MIELVVYSPTDLPLTESLECDPVAMKELGGPLPKERIPQIHEKRLKGIADGTTWWFKIVPEGSSRAAGTIGIWEGEWQGTKINEMGWMVLPEFQGRGLASAAAKILLARALSANKFRVIHAFPGRANGPSNSICRKCGFLKLEECDIDYAGRALKCNHWKIEL